MKLKNILIGAAVGTIGMVLVGLKWYDIFPSKKINFQPYKGHSFIYKNYQSHMKNIGDNFNDIFKSMEAAGHSKDSFLFIGVYFDNPELLDDKSKFRYAIGIKVDDTKAQQIFPSLENQGFLIKKLPDSVSLNTHYKYRSYCSFLLAPIFWKRIGKKYKSLKLPIDKKLAAIETYDIKNNGKIELDLISGENSNEYQFSSFAE